jgi:hypothetical protein
MATRHFYECLHACVQGMSDAGEFVSFCGDVKAIGSVLPLLLVEWLPTMVGYSIAAVLCHSAKLLQSNNSSIFMGY